MQFFDRGYTPPPAAFLTDHADFNRKALLDYFALRPEELSQTGIPFEAVNLYDDSILKGLKQLFRGKCAFCEAKTVAQPYRFRPLSEALPRLTRNSHLYYAWLADAWQNIYSICNDCMPEDPLYFPVKGNRVALPSKADLALFHEEGNGLWRGYPIKEKAILLDPCQVNDFSRHFDIDMSGRLRPLTQEADTTAGFFNLNIDPKMTVRSQALERNLKDLWEQLDRDRWEETDLNRHFNFREMEFGGSWFLLIRKYVANGGGPTWKTPDQAAAVSYFNQVAQSFDLKRRFLFNYQLIGQADAQKPTKSFRQLVPDTPPHLRSIEINTFKGLERLKLTLRQTDAGQGESTGQQSAAVLIGENAAGKSTILEAIALAMAAPEARQDLKLSPSAQLLNPQYLGGAQDVPRREGASIRVSFDDGSEHLLEISPAGFIDHGEGRQNAFPAIFAFGANRLHGRTTKAQAPSRNLKSLFQANYVLSNPETWLANLPTEKFEMVARALHLVLGFEEEFDVIRPGPGPDECQLVTLTKDPRGVIVETLTPFHLTSSGFRSVLAVACEIMFGLIGGRGNVRDKSLISARAIVLIDEIEAHLHPRWKMQVLSGFRKAFPNITFIVTTHDPLCLRGAEDGEVSLVQRLVDSRRSGWPQYTEISQDLPSISKMTVGQLLTSDFFQLLSSDDPDFEKELAEMARLLAKKRSDDGLSDEEAQRLAQFEKDLGISMPIGLSPAQQMVDEAVANFLVHRRGLTQAKLGALKENTRKSIRQALEGLVLAQG